MTTILGVDPGICGGLAIITIDDGAAPRLVDTIDIPVTGTGAKERVDAIALRDWIITHKPQHAYIERAGNAETGRQQRLQIRPGRRRNRGRVRLLRNPDVIEPSAWKKLHRLRGKDAPKPCAPAPAA